MVSRLRVPSIGELVSLAGALLLLVALWRTWYSITMELMGVQLSVDANAWQVFEFFDWIFLGLAVLAVLLVLDEQLGIGAIGGTLGKNLSALGVTVMISVAIRWWDRPGPPRSVQLPPGIELSVGAGLVMAAVAGLVIAVGGYLVSQAPAAALPGEPVGGHATQWEHAHRPSTPEAWSPPASPEAWQQPVGQGAGNGPAVPWHTEPL